MEKQITLTVRVPKDFDARLEQKLDDAFADVLYNLGCELVDSKEYRDVSESDRIVSMIREEIAVNGVSVHGMTAEEVDRFLKSDYHIGLLAEDMGNRMERFDGNEYKALEVVCEESFRGVIGSLRSDIVMDAVQCSYVSVSDNAIGYGIEADDEVIIFRDANNNMFCRLDVENFDRPLRDKIQDIRAGDAFLRHNEGAICFAGVDAHQNFDESDALWLVFDRFDHGYFEEDIGSELGDKLRALLRHLTPREPELRLDGNVKTGLDAQIQSAVKRNAAAQENTGLSTKNIGPSR